MDHACVFCIHTLDGVRMLAAEARSEGPLAFAVQFLRSWSWPQRGTAARCGRRRWRRRRRNRQRSSDTDSLAQMGRMEAPCKFPTERNVDRLDRIPARGPGFDTDPNASTLFA